MSDKFENRERFSIYIGETELAKLEVVSPKNKSQGIRDAIATYYDNPITVVKVYNTLNNRTLYLAELTSIVYKSSFLPKLISGNTDLSLEVSEHGNCIQMEIIGCFSNMKLANNYLSYLVNSDLNRGIPILNDWIATGRMSRFITVPVDSRMLSALEEYSLVKDMSIPKLVRKIIKHYMKKLAIS